MPRPLQVVSTSPRWTAGGGGSAPQHLLIEDRQEYERVLDEALRSAPHRPDLAAVGQRLNPEQLRTMALNATALITASAATEYQYYVKVREELRQPAPSTPDRGSTSPGRHPAGLATTVAEAAGTADAGAGAVAAVLVPVLTATATAIFLLLGYILKMLDPESAFARTMLVTGWVFGAVTAFAILAAAVGLLVTALRHRPVSDAGAYAELNEEVTRAKEAWREALLERGILPFLRAVLSDPSPGASRDTGPPLTPHRHTPHLGYNRPDYTSPDYTSPDYGGPETRRE
ncbi:hypothetical protein [Streptomyces sp. NPDC093598]|uniref:hypothetical protein n=1 Tax=Streptomyces sp. NPDC093598 TaxID=3366046 RepID=UPI00381DF850